LARETLEVLMQIQKSSSGEFPYAFAGYGEISAALGLHLWPSDLDIFFIFALGEVSMLQACSVCKY
jgi:hypothetical protein